MDLITSAELDKMPRTPGICAYCRRDTMVYALAEFTCRKCALDDMDAHGGTARTCGYDTGTASSGPLKCGKPARFLWDDPNDGERLVCGTHARSVRAKFLPSGGSLAPVGAAASGRVV